MTEQEWLESSDAYVLLKHLDGKISERKFRLFGSACCRRIWGLLDNDDTRRVVYIAEQVADAQAPADMLGAAWYDAYRQLISDEDADAAYNLGWGGLISNKRIFGKSVNHPNFGLWFYTLDLAWSAADAFARSKGGISCLEELPVERRDERDTLLVDLYEKAFDQETRWQVNLIRCVFGNPFRPAPIEPSWKTPSIFKLAQHVYDDRAFDRMPELADALEQAGCADRDILSHCRRPGPHVRGCWVVDLLLGKG